MDLAMMLFIDGLERTEALFRNLFELAGWSLMRVIPTPTVLRILECAPTKRNRPPPESCRRRCGVAPGQRATPIEGNPVVRHTGAQTSSSAAVLHMR